MSSIINVSAQQLRRAAVIKEQIQSLENELGRILGSSAKATVNAAAIPKNRRKMSAAVRRKMAAAAKLRWAKVKAANKS